MQFLRALANILPAALLGLTTYASVAPNAPLPPATDACTLCTYTPDCKGKAGCDLGCGFSAGLYGDYHFDYRASNGSTLDRSMITYEVQENKAQGAESSLYLKFNYVQVGSELPKMMAVNKYDVDVLVDIPLTTSEQHLVYTVKANSKCSGDVYLGTKNSAYSKFAIGYKAKTKKAVV